MSPPGLEVNGIVMRPSARLVWRLYAFVFLAFSVASNVHLVSTDFRKVVALDAAVSAVGLVGLFAFAYQRRPRWPRFWQAWALLLPAWDLAYNLVLHRRDGAPSPLEIAGAFLMFAPMYLGLWLHGRSHALGARREPAAHVSDPARRWN